MNTVALADGRRIFCLRRYETLVLDTHVAGYFSHGIAVEPGATVVDVGANVGVFSLRLLERLGGDAEVHAFEPVPPAFAALEKNLEPWKGPRLHLHQVALGAGDGEVEVTYFPRAPALSTSYTELLRAGGLADLKGGVRGGMAHPPVRRWWARLLPPALSPLIARYLVGSQRRYLCPETTLSVVLARYAVERVDLLKVDVEGAEMAVLDGVTESDWPKIRQLVVEVHDVNGRAALLQQRLAERGFREVTVEQEPSFAGTSLRNLYARR